MYFKNYNNKITHLNILRVDNKLLISKIEQLDDEFWLIYIS